jgi:hypothetical protein
MNEVDEAWEREQRRRRENPTPLEKLFDELNAKLFDSKLPSWITCPDGFAAIPCSRTLQLIWDRNHASARPQPLL